MERAGQARGRGGAEGRQEEVLPGGAEFLPAMERLSIQADGAAAVQEYLQYRRIVGEDDGGTLFTPKEYEEYKKKVLPMLLRNRLYVSWRSPTGMDCKLVGPETPCFCTHRYKQHKTDFEVMPKDRPIHVPCKVSHCQCKSYIFVPQNGSSPIRCRCKHFADEHSEKVGYQCKKCSTCAGFHSSFTCGCGHPAYTHETIIETKDERLANGKPVGYDVPYAAMGGLTGFSSLAEGYMRLDDSGIGAPASDFLQTSGSDSDHPFLRIYGNPKGPKLANDLSSMPKQVPHLRNTEAEDMAYFEKRYQERLEKGTKVLKKMKHSTPSRTKFL